MRALAIVALLLGVFLHFQAFGTFYDAWHRKWFLPKMVVVVALIWFGLSVVFPSGVSR